MVPPSVYTQPYTNFLVELIPSSHTETPTRQLFASRALRTSRKIIHINKLFLHPLSPIKYSRAYINRLAIVPKFIKALFFRPFISLELHATTLLLSFVPLSAHVSERPSARRKLLLSSIHKYIPLRVRAWTNDYLFSSSRRCRGFFFAPFLYTHKREIRITAQKCKN